MGMQLPLTETEIYLVINFVSVTSINNLNAKDANILSRFWIFFFFYYSLTHSTSRNEIYFPGCFVTGLLYIKNVCYRTL